MKLDILAFGVHPDDVELGCSGTLLLEIASGKSAGIIDLTQGELGTRGTIETRKQEAENARKVLGIAVRENLKMKDGFFEHNEENILKIISVIRKYRPEIIFCNAPEDRHPDHGRSAKLVEDAAFLSGLRKISCVYDGDELEAWRPKYVFNYLQDRFIEPDFVIDISEFIDKKLESVLCYKTQFYNENSNEPQTYISTPQFLDAVKSRALHLGKRIGVNYAEGFISKKTIGIKNLEAFIQKTT